MFFCNELKKPLASLTMCVSFKKALAQSFARHCCSSKKKQICTNKRF